MRSVSVALAKAGLSGLLVEVEAGAEVAITRRGKVIARLVPAQERSGAELFAPLWEQDFSALQTPEDPAEAALAALDLA
jgi:prevent-host-death family protein